MDTVEVNQGDAPTAPPRNSEATNVQQVYTLENGILSSDEMIKLKAAATKLCEEYTTLEKIEHGAQTKYFSDFFAKILNEYKEIDSDNLAVAIYMEAILNFINMKAREVAKGPKAMQQFVPIELRQKVFRIFTDEQKNIVPATRDSAICYVIVLALMVNRYCVEFGDLSSSIRGKADQLKNLIRVTGASILTDVPTKLTCVVLKLPLDTHGPSVVVKGRKGRKQVENINTVEVNQGVVMFSGTKKAKQDMAKEKKKKFDWDSAVAKVLARTSDQAGAGYKMKKLKKKLIKMYSYQFTDADPEKVNARVSKKLSKLHSKYCVSGDGKTIKLQVK